MRPLLRLSSLLVAGVLVGALGFLFRINTVRAQRVNYISALTQTAPLPTDAASPTGYMGGIRDLIVPEHNNESYQWIAQTQQMLTNGTWRVRHVDYDNAPGGREIYSASPYRWWLGIVAWLDHKLSGRNLPLAAEHAAICADPVLHGLLLTITVIFAAWRFGALPAALLGLAFATLFPFAGSFSPGQPADHGIAQVAVLWSILPLLAGVFAKNSGRPARIWFFLAGMAGGFALWISVQRATPILIGLAVGGIAAAWLARRTAGNAAPSTAALAPWRAWSLGGALAILAAWLIEYFPNHLGLTAWRLELLHPLYAVAWLGGGELLARAVDRIQSGKSAPTGGRDRVIVGLAILAVLALPALMIAKSNRAWLTSDALASHLTNLANGTAADHLFAWILRDGVTLTLAATCLPLVLVVVGGWLLLRRTTDSAHRAALAISFGPLVIALGFACVRLRWWNVFDSTALALIVAATAAICAAAGSRALAWAWATGVTLLLIPGAVLLVPSSSIAVQETVSEIEIESLIERDLSHWLANRVGPGGAVVFAPPALTTSLYFHGGLRGIATPYPDNKEGFAAAVRIAAASSADEAQALVRKRNVAYIVMPSWDTFLDDFARLGSNQPEHTLVGLLHQWLPPRWLRPVPYHLPQIAGFEGQSVLVFEVVDVQDNVTALSHLAEYFAEMGQNQQAAAVAQALANSFPTEVSSLIAQAQVAIARRDGASFGPLLKALLPRLNEDEAQALAWDRRVSLAIVLAEGKQKDPAREHVERCLAELDEPLMRALSPVTLYRLQVLSKAFGLEITEPSLRELALTLLPPEMRRAL